MKEDYRQKDKIAELQDSASEAVFGRYKPDNSTLFVRTLTKMGISRGGIKKWIIKQWKKKGYSTVDIRIRGVNYRLGICDNTTDAKILTASRYYDRLEIRCLSDAITNISDATFVDIGANTGYYSLNLARLGYKKIIAIEPNPPAIMRLLFNIKINNMEREITVVPLCIGNGETVSFYSSGGLGDASLFSKSHANIKPIMLQSKSLLNILLEQRVDRVDGLKIDIEGFEDECLMPFYESAPSELWPRVVIIEYCHGHLWKQDVLKKMRNIGYREICQSRSNKVLKRE